MKIYVFNCIRFFLDNELYRAKYIIVADDLGEAKGLITELIFGARGPRADEFVEFGFPSLHVAKGAPIILEEKAEKIK